MRYDQILIPSGFRIEGTVTGTLPVIEYNDYLSLNFLFCQNVVVKSVITNQKLNEYLIQTGKIQSVPDDEDSKYYLNISGVYHFTDTAMKIMSLDTMEEIDFTVANLKEHVRTLETYRLRYDYRLNLIAKYPNQDILVHGILNPVDLNTAINAKNGAILGAPLDLIEAQEVELLSNLQEWIYAFYFRWDVKAFNLHHSLYSLAQVSLFYQKLVERLLVTRDSFAETPQAHSFYMNQRLLSNGIPRSSLNSLTTSQKVIVSRNIKYYRRFPGNEYTRDKLVDAIFTQRAFPFGQLLYEKNQTDQSLPAVDYKIKSLNNIVQRDDVITLDEVKTDPLFGYDDLDYNRLQISPYSVGHTKWYYSNYSNYTDILPVKQQEFILSQWAYFAEANMLKMRLPLVVDKTNVYLDAKTALLYYQLLTMSLIDKIPNRFTDLTFDFAYMGLPNIEYGYHYKDLESLMAGVPKIKNMVSFEAFHIYLINLYNAFYSLKRLAVKDHRLIKRSNVRDFVNNVFTTTVLTSPELSVSDWLTLNRLTIPTDHVEVNKLCDLIYYSFAGDISQTFSNLAIAHKELGKLFLHLSSYSVKLYVNDNESPLTQLPFYQTGYESISKSSLSTKTQRCDEISKTGASKKVQNKLISSYGHYTASSVNKQTYDIVSYSNCHARTKPSSHYFVAPTHFTINYTGDKLEDDYQFVTGVNLNHLVNLNEVNIPLPVTIVANLEP